MSHSSLPRPLPSVAGRLERYENFPSAYVQPRHVDVWLPEGYAEGDDRFYFDDGTLGADAPYAPYQARADAVLRAAGYTPGQDWVTRAFPGAGHSEADWRARLEIPLTFLLGRLHDR